MLAHMKPVLHSPHEAATLSRKSWTESWPRRPCNQKHYRVLRWKSLQTPALKSRPQCRPHPTLPTSAATLHHLPAQAPAPESTCWVESRSCGRGAEMWPHLELGGHSDEGSWGTTESTGPTAFLSPKLPGHHGSLSCPARGMVASVRSVSLRACTMDETFTWPSDRGRDPCYGHSHDNFLPT